MVKARNHSIVRTKQLSIAEGALWSAMVGAGTYFITPFALLLGASSFMIGLLKSFSMLATAAGQYLGAWRLQFEGNRRSMIARFAAVQALLWIPLALLPVLPFEDKPLLLVGLYALISLFGALVAPAWTSLMRDVVGKRERGTYFGMRNRLIGFVEFASSLVAGAFLSWMIGNPVLGFGIVFGAAFFFRYASSRLLNQHRDLPFRPAPEPFLKIIRLPKDRFFRNVLYLSTGMVLATGIAGPFFSVYMLRELGFNYFEFSVALAVSTLAYVVTQSYWGRVIDKYGTRPVLFSTAALIPFIPLLWVPADNFLYVVLVQVYSGVVWSGFDLSAFNFLLKIAPRDSLHDYAAHLNGLSSLATFGGGIMGSFLALAFENMTMGLISGLQIIFVISALARFIVALLAVPRITSNMSVEGPAFLMRVITVYPVKGVLAELTAARGLIGAFIGHRNR